MQDSQLALEQPKYDVVVTEVPKFDLSSYIANYKGRTVFRRLHLIAYCSTALREEAARLAVAEAKKGSDLRNYYEAVALLKRISTDKSLDSLIDSAWAAQQEKKNAAETHRLENELKGYKNNLIKESIRMGNEDLGTHYYTIGDLGNAVKAYSRMRDYCTTPAHIASTALRIIAVAVEQKNWMAVQSQVHRIRNLQMKPDDALRTQPKTASAMGLQQMSTGEYRDAALSFLNTDPGLSDSYNEIITSNDVAVYGGLCALASMTRVDLQKKVLDSPSFRNFLELEPHIRRAISFFCTSKYSQCLEILESYRADYLLDIYLQPHVADIYKRVRTKSIVQYFQPFSKVTLASMEKMFGTPTLTTNGSHPSSFQDELITLIETGKLDACIDLETGVLVARESNARADMQREASEMIDRFIKEARSKLIRLNVINAGLEVKAPARKKQWDQQGGTGGGGGGGGGVESWMDQGGGGYAPGQGGRSLNVGGNLNITGGHSLRTGR